MNRVFKHLDFCDKTALRVYHRPPVQPTVYPVFSDFGEAWPAAERNLVVLIGVNPGLDLQFCAADAGP